MHAEIIVLYTYLAVWQIRDVYTHTGCGTQIEPPIVVAEMLLILSK